MSPYFKPLVPLLNNLQCEIILPLESDKDGNFGRNVPLCHDIVIKHIILALSKLPDKYWVPDPTLDGHEDQAVTVASEQNDDSVSESGPAKSDAVDDEDRDMSSSAPPPVLQRSIGGRCATRSVAQSNPELCRKQPTPSQDEPVTKHLRSSGHRSACSCPTPT